MEEFKEIGFEFESQDSGWKKDFWAAAPAFHRLPSPVFIFIRPGGGDGILILHTNNVTGYLFPYDRALQATTRQPNALQEELKGEKEAGIQGNRFRFKPEALEKMFPENEEIKKWISGAGIDKDWRRHGQFFRYLLIWL